MRRIVIALALLGISVSNSAAQSAGDPSDIDAALVKKTVNVCWGEDGGECATDRAGWPGTTHQHACNENNKGGWSTSIICPEVCGVKYGPKCLAYTKPEWGWKGGNCGYRLSVVACYK